MNFSISALSLRRRITISISLVSIIPLVILFYHFFGYEISLWAKLSLVVVVLSGWLIVFEVFESIVKVHMKTRTTLETMGEVAPDAPDEVQSLETIIGLLSDKVKSGFEQLRDFTQMTGELNKEVSRKVLILSTILQANDLFSKDAPAEEVIKFLCYHLKQLLAVEACFCNLKSDLLGEIKMVGGGGVDPEKVKVFLKKRNKDFMRLRKLIVLDTRNVNNAYLSWLQDLSLRNIAVVPIISKGQMIGMIGVGNNESGFVFSKDDLDVLNLFGQNITLIWEHERLSSKIEELEVLDYLTGLYNEKVIVKRLDEEIKRAMVYQRPCGFLRASITNFDVVQKDLGQIEAEKMLKVIGRAFKAGLKAIDIAGRIEASAFGAILIESNKRESRDVAESLEKSLENICGDKVKLAFSVAESPINGTTAEELMNFSKNQNG